MARPPAKELTQRELEVMQTFWKRGELSVADVQMQLSAGGLERAYTTVATLVRILLEKGFVEQTNNDRPFLYRPVRSYEEVSGRLLRDLVERVFQGSREKLLVRLMGEKKLTANERALLEEVLKDQT